MRERDAIEQDRETPHCPLHRHWMRNGSPTDFHVDEWGNCEVCLYLGDPNDFLAALPFTKDRPGPFAGKPMGRWEPRAARERA